MVDKHLGTNLCVVEEMLVVMTMADATVLIVRPVPEATHQ